jgi:hypothetical protein
MVPWNAPLPAPGASNVVEVVFRSLAFAERPGPDVARLTANTSKRAVPVTVHCNDALFVLLLLFMIFPAYFRRIGHSDRYASCTTRAKTRIL